MGTEEEFWGISSVGRAIGSQSIGRGFESPILQLKNPLVRAGFSIRRMGDSKRSTDPEARESSQRAKVGTAS